MAETSEKLPNFLLIKYHPPGLKRLIRAMADNKNYSRYQQNVIKRYYENADSIGLQRAQELVTELYLAEGKKREKVWETLAKNLLKAGIPQKQVDHLRAQDNPEMVVKVISEKL